MLIQVAETLREAPSQVGVQYRNHHSQSLKVSHKLTVAHAECLSKKSTSEPEPYNDASSIAKPMVDSLSDPVHVTGVINPAAGVKPKPFV